MGFMVQAPLARYYTGREEEENASPTTTRTISQKMKGAIEPAAAVYRIEYRDRRKKNGEYNHWHI